VRYIYIWAKVNFVGFLFRETATYICKYMYNIIDYVQVTHKNVRKFYYILRGKPHSGDL